MNQHPYHGEETELGMDVYENKKPIGVVLKNKNNLPAVAGKGIAEYRLASGHRVTAFTGACFGTVPNQDRIVVIPERNIVSVIDGYGTNGAIAAGILAIQQIACHSFREAVEGTCTELKRRNIQTDGACVIQAEQQRTESGEPWICKQLGDVKFLQANRPPGMARNCQQILCESKDQTLAQLYVEYRYMSADQALVHDERSVVMNSVHYDAENNSIPTILRFRSAPETDQTVEIIGCDGVFDNMTEGEALYELMHLPPTEAIKNIVTLISKRMAWAKDLSSEAGILREAKERFLGERERFSDGYRTKPKPDNISIAIIDRPKN